jgi:hypothetical protein
MTVWQVIGLALVVALLVVTGVLVWIDKPRVTGDQPPDDSHR